MQSTCSVETCDRKAIIKGLCRSHDRRRRTTGSALRPCARCGDDLPLGTPPKSIYCNACKSKCSVDGCTNPIRRNGFCNSHSARVRRNGAHERRCKTCSGAIPFEAGVGLRYCSDACRPTCKVEGCELPCLAKGLCKEHYRRVASNGSVSRKCLTCGCEFAVGNTRGRKYCSDKCAPKCSAIGCEDRAEDSGYCGRHGTIYRRIGDVPSLDYVCTLCGRQVRRDPNARFVKRGRKCCTECAAKTRRDHKKFRDAVIASGSAICGICGDDIALSLRWPDAMSLSIDHIIPLARGGTNEDHNLQPAHLRCNFRKGARLAIPEQGVAAIP